MMPNFGDMKKMYDSYKKLQDVLKNTIIRSKEDGLIVDITAENKIKSVTIDDETLLADKERLERTIVAALVKGQNKAQEIAMQKTKEVLGFDPNDLAGMMAGGGMPKIPGM
ncbi:MAG: YbaB/EbfC family nucleoid-associated protein [Candidatus Absconditabacteria bacterium]